jgi:hypothetical protein
MRDHAKDLEKLAKIDEIGASQGYLVSIERNILRERLTLEAEALKRPRSPPVAPKRASKGTAPNTLNAIRAMAALLQRDGIEGLNQSSLANKAAELAQELSLPGADKLGAVNNSSERAIAKAFLQGVQAANES